MRGEAEIVVRRQIDDRLSIERGVRCLLAVEDSQMTIKPLLLE